MARGAQDRRRVVVTGLGCVSPLGLSAATTWKAAIGGASGISRLPGDEVPGLATRLVGRVEGEIPSGDLGPKERRRIDRVMLLALAGSDEAIADAGLDLGSVDRARVGVAIGTAIGGITTLLANHAAYIKGGPRRVSPFAIPMSLANMPGGFVAIRHGFGGPNFAHVSACATGSHSIGEATRAIERGDADVMLAGGAEATNSEMVLAGFGNMQALSKRDDDPERASRPFDLERDGFVMAEGSGVVVLEARDHALARGARVRAELLGYAATADAVHIAAPDESGGGAMRCMRLALADAGVEGGDVGYVNAHATSTPTGDRIEATAIRGVLGERVPVSSTKGMTGHMLGAAGAVEAIFCVKAMEAGLLPPTINLERPDPACALEHVANKALQADVPVALSNSFGFGGANAALVLGRAEQ